LHGQRSLFLDFLGVAALGFDVKGLRFLGVRFKVLGFRLRRFSRRGLIFGVWGVPNKQAKGYPFAVLA